MRGRILLVAVAVSLALTGCWSRIEVNDLAIVTMAGLDRDPDGSLRLSLQIVVPHQIPHPGGAGMKMGSPVHVVSATGTSAVDIVEKLQLQVARRLYFAHTNPFIIGERLASTGMQPVEDFLNRFGQIRLRSYLMVVQGDPLVILKARPAAERLPSEAVRQLERSGVGLETGIWEWTRERRTEGIDPVLPWLKAVPPVENRPDESGTALDLKAEGSALFAGARLVAWLDAPTTRGLRLLRGEMVSGRLAAPLGDDGMVGVRVDRSEVQRRVFYERGHPAAAVQVRLEVSLGDLQPPVDARDPALLIELEKAVSTALTAEMQGALEQAREAGVDPFGFGFMIHQAHPRLWHQIGGRWREEFREFEVAISVLVDMDRSKLITRPSSIPDGEMLQR